MSVVVSDGLGWPTAREESSGVTPEVGWPRGEEQPTPVRASSTEVEAVRTVEADGDADPPAIVAPVTEAQFPLASRVREDLADVTTAEVSRETPSSWLSSTDAPVSRETSPPTVSRETVSAVDLLRRGRQWPAPRAPRILTVANQKGGVGKTTTTVNVAAAMAQHGLRVLVIDLDPQGNSSTGFGIDHRSGIPSIYEVLVGETPLSDVIYPVEELPGLACAPATIDLAGAEIELVSLVARESRLRRALAGLTHSFDYIFIDCPPSLGLLTVNALVAAPEALIPIQCEFYALEGLSQLLRNIELVRAHLNPSLHVSTILLTMYDARTRLAEQVAQEVRDHFGDRVLGTTIPRSVRISEAPGFGQTVMTYDPTSRGAVAYLDAAREIAERGAQEGTE